MRWTSLATAASLLLAGWSTAAPIITTGEGLTEETWEQVKSGTWLIEHYSPYCHHCKAFAPKWHDLVELREADSAINNFHFAQVDCAANGDLCHSHGVKYYPSIFLYVDGELYDEYSGKRSVEALSAYVDENMPGKVVWLGDDGESEVKGGPVKVEEKQVEEKKKAARPVVPLKGAAVGGAAAGGALHVAAGEDDSTTSPFDAILDDASTTARTSSSSSADAEPSTSAEKPAVPAFVTQIRKMNFEEKRNESNAPRPDGVVHVLKAEEVAGLKDADSRPSFVKFYAPWCGHCKALAPLWADMATSLAGSVNVYEMDCDTPENKKVCRGEKVRAYPTLIFYNKGASVEYKGKRDVQTLKNFALKAVSATTIKPLANKYELKQAAEAEEVIILFLHTPKRARLIYSADSFLSSQTVATSAASTLVGGAPFYTSTSPDLYSLFSLPAEPYLLAFKDGSLSPANTFALPSHTLPAKSRLEATKHWLRSAKFPTLTELSSATFDDLMPSTGEPPLVGVAVLSKKGLPGKQFEAAKTVVERLAKGWSERRMSKEESKKGRDVLWTWVDGDKWAGWVRTMYDVKNGAADGPKLLIADPKTLVYWKSTLSGSPLSFEHEEVYSLIEQGITTGTLAGLSSRTFMEKFADSLSNGPSSLFTSASDHPFITISLVVLSWVAMWFTLKWCMRPIAPETANAKYD
ncbi:thioredoxin-like protein [Leucosporidium creatinivorum]|uniref:Thioredoxin-like protein n=1 Tax=Leucosporidium creatinivorum TaxID=106004 RepID=A0A1Y2ESG9_9BASI|nr:thioredoxin-like protein [Leucosporidium creatinivorum]